MADLQDLKPGDEVAIVQTYPRDRAPYIVTIERVTPSQILADGRRWNRQTGAERARDRFYRQHLEPATDEHRNAEERKRLWETISWAFTGARLYETRRTMSTEAMRTIAGAIKADEARRGERG